MDEVGGASYSVSRGAVLDSRGSCSGQKEKHMQRPGSEADLGVIVRVLFRG